MGFLSPLIFLPAYWHKNHMAAVAALAAMWAAYKTSSSPPLAMRKDGQNDLLFQSDGGRHEIHIILSVPGAPPPPTTCRRD